jgi:hypothetical protein
VTGPDQWEKKTADDGSRGGRTHLLDEGRGVVGVEAAQRVDLLGHLAAVEPRRRRRGRGVVPLAGVVVPVSVAVPVAMALAVPVIVVVTLIGAAMVRLLVGVGRRPRANGVRRGRAGKEVQERRKAALAV